VLAYITNQQNAVAIFEPVQKLVHLLCACEARFVQNVQAFLYASLVIALRKMPLERARFDSRLCEFLCRSRGWGESFNFVTVSLGSFANHS